MTTEEKYTKLFGAVKKLLGFDDPKDWRMMMAELEQARSTFGDSEELRATYELLKVVVELEAKPVVVPTKLLAKDTIRDGGTIRLTTDTGNFYVDRRIGSKTRDEVFDDYPSEGAKVPSEVAAAVRALLY